MSQGDTNAEVKGTVVVIDDEEGLVKSLHVLLSRAGFKVIPCTNPQQGLAAIQRAETDAVLVDLNMPEISGMDILAATRAQQLDVEVVMMTGHATVATAVAAVRAGAWDYLTKPFDSLEDVVGTVSRAVQKRRLVVRNRELERLVDAQEKPDFIGESARMRAIFQLIERVGASTATILIQGESGTGKELVARAVHRRSARSRRPFVAINCAAMTQTLLESELFGHAKGAFTGAHVAKRGLFEAANGGTLFLDEIGDVAGTTQVALLRAVQEGEIRPVGSTEIVKVDVRVIAATNVDLKRAVASGKFREDLFYRLNVISIELPPLRDRPTDIPLLAYHFLRQYSARSGKKLERFSSEALHALAVARWAGNVRELENVVERAVVLAQGDEVSLRDLPNELAEAANPANVVAEEAADLPYGEAKRQVVATFDRRYLSRLLAKTGGNITAAAALAHLDRSNFRRLLRQYELGQTNRDGASASHIDA